MLFRKRRSKKKRKNGPCDKTKHHRKPASLGGRNFRGNIFYVPRFKHEAWHILFDNFPASKIVELFQEFYEIFGTDKKKSKFRSRRNREWIRTKSSRLKKKLAWDTLFGGMTLEKIVDQINEIWIDPNYRLVIVPDKINRVILLGAKW